MTVKAKEHIELAEAGKVMTDHMYAKIEKEAKKNWDLFYKVNKTNFYKDRHYIKFEFMEMADRIADSPEGSVLTLLDAGCGVGNGLYPLLKEYEGHLKVHCCDFSPRAIDFVKNSERFNPDLI